MPYTNDPINSKTDELRLLVGDIDEDCELLSDNDYKYFLNRFNNNPFTALKHVAYSILAKLAKYRRERTGQIEVYGAESFENYYKFVKDILDNPNSSINSIKNGLIFGGVSRQAYYDSISNPDNTDPIFYRGQSDRVLQALTHRVSTIFGEVEYDEWGCIINKYYYWFNGV